MARSADPSGVAVPCDVDGDEWTEGVEVGTGVAMAHDSPVDLIGDDQGQRGSRGSECLLDAGGIKEAKGDVKGFTEASVVVVMDYSGMYHDADPELLVQASSGGETSVVTGQQLVECGDGMVQHDWLGGLVGWTDEGKKPVAAVYETVTVTPMDTCRTQCLIEQIVQSAAEFSFDGVWATGGLFDVDGHNDAVPRPASRRRKPVRDHVDHVGSYLLPEKESRP